MSKSFSFLIYQLDQKWQPQKCKLLILLIRDLTFRVPPRFLDMMKINFNLVFSIIYSGCLAFFYSVFCFFIGNQFFFSVEGNDFFYNFTRLFLSTSALDYFFLLHFLFLYVQLPWLFFFLIQSIFFL